MYEPFYAFILKVFPKFKIDPTRFDPFLECREVDKGDLLFQDGDICEFMGFTLKGCIRMYLVKDEQEYTLSFHAEHQSFGDYRSFQRQQPTSFFCEAIEHSKILVLNHQAIRFLEELPDGQKFLRLHAESLAFQMRDKVLSLFVDTPEERYLKLIETETHLLQRVTQYHLASYLGIKPESLRRLKRRIYNRVVS